MSIQHIFARQIYDSRGNPTVEVDLQTEAGNAECDGCKYAGAYHEFLTGVVPNKFKQGQSCRIMVPIFRGSPMDPLPRKNFTTP